MSLLLEFKWINYEFSYAIRGKGMNRNNLLYIKCEQNTVSGICFKFKSLF